MRYPALLAVCAVLISLPLHAAPQVQVVGLFPNAAVLLVDGQRKLVKAGQTGPGGVQVVSADSQGAVLRINGVTQRFAMTREYSAGFTAPTRQTVSLAKRSDGHFWANGTVNGQSITFLIDTGATSVAMNEGDAKRLGLDFRVLGVPAVVSTASGQAKGWKLRLDRVSVGGIEVLGVDAIVLEGSSPQYALLGMTYLSRVGWREQQGMLVLESKL